MLTLIQTLSQKMSRRAQDQRDYALLTGMNDRMLADIGVTRSDLRKRVFNRG